MFDNGLNQDTVYYVGLNNEWHTTEDVCQNINLGGYAITTEQTRILLNSLLKAGKVEYTVHHVGFFTYQSEWRRKVPNSA